MVSLLTPQHPNETYGMACHIIMTCAVLSITQIALTYLASGSLTATTGKILCATAALSAVSCLIWKVCVYNYRRMKSVEKATFEPNVLIAVVKVLTFSLLLGMRIYLSLLPLFKNNLPKQQELGYFFLGSVLFAALPAFLISKFTMRNEQKIFSEGLQEINASTSPLDISEDNKKKIYSILIRANSENWPGTEELYQLFYNCCYPNPKPA